MSETVVIILAAGEYRRWGFDIPKHLAEVGGELIIHRMIRQTQELGFDPIVITQEPSIYEIVPEYYRPEKYGWTVETLFSTIHLWKEHTIVLLGDVVFSQDCLLKLFNGEELVYGNNNEIFGLHIMLKDEMKIITALQKAILNARDGGRGKLWEFYRAYIGVDLRQHLFNGDFRHIDDWTDDIDTLDEYIRISRKFLSGEIH